MGAKSVADLYKRRVVTKEEAERLLGFCNNAGPSFLFGVVASFFPDLSTVWLLWAIHIGSACLTALILSGNREGCSDGMTECGCHSKDIMLDSIKALCSVCGWVILFRVMITFLRAWFLWYFPEWMQVLIIGFLELSNGCCELMSVVNRNGRFIICAGMLAFGGLCVLLQTMSVTKGLSLRMYLRGKLLQTVFSVLVSCGIVMNHGYLFAVPVIPLLIVLIKNQKWYRKESCYPV